MIGIYKITNKLSGKIYVGQSNNIERRFTEHRYKGEESRIPLDVAIKKYGVENFEYEVLEECSTEELNDREKFWIKNLDSINKGYNCNSGGDNGQVGSQNSNSKLIEEDIIIIRRAYNNLEPQREVYDKHFSDIVSFGHFQNIWQGRIWSHIMPEVFTKENRQHYIVGNSRGQRGKGASFTNEEVLMLRNRYVNESAKAIYEGYEDRVKFGTFQAMLWGRTYKDVPVYSKKLGQWIE